MCVSDDRHGMKMDETCEKSKVLALPAEISLGISHIFLGWVNTTGYMLNTLCGTICWKSLESCWTLSTTSIFNGKK
jgi:hypothetical protein